MTAQASILPGRLRAAGVPRALGVRSAADSGSGTAWGRKDGGTGGSVRRPRARARLVNTMVVGGPGRALPAATVAEFVARPGAGTVSGPRNRPWS